MPAYIRLPRRSPFNTFITALKDQTVFRRARTVLTHTHTTSKQLKAVAMSLTSAIEMLRVTPKAGTSTTVLSRAVDTTEPFERHEPRWWLCGYCQNDEHLPWMNERCPKGDKKDEMSTKCEMIDGKPCGRCDKLTG